MLHFTVKLWHGDDTIVVDRVKQMRRSPGLDGYDWVIRFDGLKLVELRRHGS
ncbi:MAG TPA: hypothetical protein VN428_06760 [Bryobacteraceae bacterium]|nr:hypothetical protein [Bryobacteraceae bacterium]